MSYQTEQSRADLEHRFSFHPADSIARQLAHEGVRGACKALAHYLDEALPPGRHKALAHTALEDVMHRANAAIACHVPAD
ncbi:hypothetical protein SEA_SYRA333_4 [Mycobacterium phage Syra333]|uniref:Acb2/Tad1 hairpin domain-containing protein n=2 Tax=Unicornvirus TaxID=2948939 RepID=A0A222ZM71_9CAUD|nr:hypothetical protein I5G80_gp004 [Mycobacterium phage Krueger]YP_009951572.1 hypothetical protein I5G82_gp102 [Mycobacterium phage Ximenita]UTN93195.1 hypothetical protein SEA_SUNFLOWER1121_3 [Mycobacterium Phage Sunflower1121]WNM67481.1 hypothetical protein SEA_SHADOW1_3 [Mycobacterium phage Shadow1]WNM69516.1 hypothetical protein SEA_SYRA333_4 [Mycobacterium phage Syra333]ASR85505.1 hypothetical protein SEA_KRUEGER_4 [Mycobacterium phage Krueger]QIG61515.1 hypothetical protein SEA_XIMENI